MFFYIPLLSKFNTQTIMKKMIYSLLTLILGLVLSGAGCSPDAFVTDPNPDFFGTWEYAYDSHWQKVTISADKFTFLSDGGDTYTMEELSWKKVTTTGAFASTYPIGCRISGKLTNKTGSYSPLQSDGTPYSVGKIAIMWWYLSADKKSLLVGNAFTPAHEPQGEPWVKQ
jgi:hypothetical protein